MQHPDGPSLDKHAWAAAAGEHGREVYRDDDDNDVDAQRQRLTRLQLLAQREIAAGWQPHVVKFHDFLNALASAKTCKQPGSDGVDVRWYALSVGQPFCGCVCCSWCVRVAGRLRDLRLGVRWC